MLKLVVSILAFVGFMCEASAQNELNYSEKSILLKYKSDVCAKLDDQLTNNSIINVLNTNYGVEKMKVCGSRKLQDTYVLFFSKNQSIPAVIAEYMNTGLFELVEPNYIGQVGGKMDLQQTLPNDTYFSRQYSHVNNGTFSATASTVDADVDMDLAWDIEVGDASIVVSVIDTGIKLNHPEFGGRVFTNAADGNDGSDNDGNGYIDDVNGWDFADDDNNPSDPHGHGTNVAGIIGANGNNSAGYAGADWNCKIMPCKIIDQSGGILYSYWIDAIYYSVDNGANIINMSLGGTGTSTLLKNAVDYAYNNNVTIFVSMMNANNNVSYYPAAYANTIAVGSTNAQDNRSNPFFWGGGSNFGNHIDFVAPGSYIYGLSNTSNTDYNTYWGGTSQASPLAAGIGALLLAQDPTRTPDDIRSIMRSTAEDQVGNPSEDVAGFDIYYGYGRLNAHQALLQSTSGVTELSANANVVVFPNPSSSDVTIKSSKGFASIQVFDLKGAELIHRQLSTTKNSEMLTISSLMSGVYFVQLLDSNGNEIAKIRFIKND